MAWRLNPEPPRWHFQVCLDRNGAPTQLDPAAVTRYAD